MKMRWRLTAYYSDKAEPPKHPGRMAYQVEIADEDYEKSLDYKIFKEREDIGVVDVEGLL